LTLDRARWYTASSVGAGRRLQLQATLSLPIHNQLLKALMKD
jgi:hypothetical protein